MALFNTESMVFLDVVHNFDCVYNKFSKDFKNKFKKYNCWIKIGESLGFLLKKHKKASKHLNSIWQVTEETYINSFRVWSQRSSKGGPKLGIAFILNCSSQDHR